MSLFDEVLDFSEFKAYGLSYHGSKKLIAPQLLQKMHELHYERHGVKAVMFVDCFGGGGSMSLSALQLGFKTIYNELRPDLCYLFNELKRRDLPFEFCDPNEFKEILKIPREKRTLEQICKNLFFSFNLNGLTYAIKKDYNVVKAIFYMMIKKGITDEVRLKYINEFMPNRSTYYSCLSYYNLNEIKNTLNLDKMQIINGDYKNLNLSDFNPCEVMIYADIPYQDKKSKSTYKGVYDDNFDIKEFLEWAKSLSQKGHNIYVSEYNIPSTEFNEVLVVEKLISCHPGINSIRYEKMFKL